MMAEKYTSDMLGVVIAQIAQTIGYSSTQSAPLELLEDILQRFIQELARDLHSQAEHANRVELNLKDALLSLSNLNINVNELLDYIGNVEPIPFVRDVPIYPVKRSSNLNFLKPGSVETLTRPVHIFEYLPPMLPTESAATVISTGLIEKCDHEQIPPSTSESGHKTAIKLLPDLKTDIGMHKCCSQSDLPLTLNSSSRDNFDHDGHAIREISSVVMTTGGFISPAIEGKLPEAFVPDIIDKLKGLDAPPLSPPPKTPNEPKNVFNETIDVSMAKRITFSETISPTAEQGVAQCQQAATASERSEVNMVLGAGATSIPVVPPANTKTAKKSKKKKLLGAQAIDPARELTTNKAQEKAHRKALKIYQKLSKNQMEGGNNLQKSIKNLNRGMLSALPDGSAERLQLEKLLKKQTKQRQKQLKNQKQQRQQLQQVFNLPGVFPNVPIPLVSVGSRDSAPDFVPLATQPQPQPMVPTNMAENMLGLVGGFGSTLNVENKDTFPTDFVVPIKDISNAGAVTNPNTLSDEIKLASEPDRNKLNIFKKISKQKALNPLNIAKTMFENAGNGSPLINLPSGTTITPAPALSATESVQHNFSMSMSNISTYDSFGGLSDPTPTATADNLLAPDVNKPKKRGRKPGGKNQVRFHAATSITATSTLIQQSPKKIKSTKLNPVFSYTPETPLNKNPTIFPNIPLPMEPLNLSSVDQFKAGSHFTDNVGFIGDITTAGEAGNGTITEKLHKTKEKKERKKCKSKYQLDHEDSVQLTNMGDFNKKLTFIESDKNSKNTSLQAKPGKVHISSADLSDAITNQALGYVTGSAPSNLPKSSTLYGNQPNMMPMLPLLHFPPRPGLIPSGPAIFTSTALAGFSKKVTGPNIIMPQTFMSFPNANIGHKAQNIEKDDKSILYGLLPHGDAHFERSYCNVTPLVPDSMKLPNALIDSNKIRSPERFAFDPKPSNECSGKDTEHQSPISGFIPLTGQGVGLSGIDDVSTTNQGSRSTKTIKPTPAATGNLGDPIEVSDDSNDDDESKSKSKNNKQIGAFPYAHGLKSNLIQPSNISNSGLRQLNESAHSSLLNANQMINSPISDSKQFKKDAKAGATKLNQTDSKVLALAAGSPHSQSQTHPNTHPHTTHTSPFNINFMSSDKFSLAGGADLIPLSRVDSGLAYSSLTVPATSLTAGATSGSMPSSAAPHAEDQSFMSNFVGSVNYDDITITPTNNMQISELKLHKLHKKIKKPKDGKIKKKKDKKDKTRSKEKSEEKHLLNIEKIKSQDKKPKKDKKKEKQVTPDGLHIFPENLIGSTDQAKNLPPVSIEVGVAADYISANKSQAQMPHLIVSPKLDLSPNQVPKLTLKLSGKSTPTATPFEGDHDHTAIKTEPTTTIQTPTTQTKKEQSPELARFSPLVTGPPKPKQCETITMNLSAAAPCSPSVFAPISNTQPMPMSIIGMQSAGLNVHSSNWIPNSGSAASATLSASSVLLPQQLMHQPSKQMPKMSAVSTPTVASSEGAQLLPTTPELNRPSSYVDAEGYRIWICPACGKVDDGSAMIGCDGCDAWYHWTCVGIHVAPNDNEDWFCRVCITKKKGSGLDKKKKRNKKK
ncbi:GH23929 [Drosophila grimshawi]|uniref:GH23929 n=3 Tax=Drosophila grimshawi TaxID=7222 RepID=B4JZV6_DROGR|nr:GH23929 [Drosophila grimshawi]